MVGIFLSLKVAAKTPSAVLASSTAPCDVLQVRLSRVSSAALHLGSYQQPLKIFPENADESDKRIAMDLQMAIPTVRTHMTRLFRKLRANDRADLMLHVFRQFRSGCRQRTCPRI